MNHAFEDVYTSDLLAASDSEKSTLQTLLYADRDSGRRESTNIGIKEAERTGEDTAGGIPYWADELAIPTGGIRAVFAVPIEIYGGSGGLDQ